ncbi:hypothetical protein BDN72DRAFT_833668 [Pluteus cervinus]|uniref:Uncharacterized protein n=1 Tax=Pluteus cervinus TaxID=181527 RepID=A0ACD3B906_9AGAR|nr:hypothetical protein BDN72DRAFT_833668 [Pluteus cervinus]
MEAAIATSSIKLGFEGIKYVVVLYKKSLLKYQVRKWQGRVKEALNEVIEVKDYLTQEEIDVLLFRANRVLSLIAVLDGMSSNQSTWFSQRGDVRILEKNSFEVVSVAHQVSSKALTRMLENGAGSKINKKQLLKRIRNPKVKRSTHEAVKLLADVANAYADSVDSNVGIEDLLTGETGLANLSLDADETEPLEPSTDEADQSDSGASDDTDSDGTEELETSIVVNSALTGNTASPSEVAAPSGAPVAAAPEATSDGVHVHFNVSRPAQERIRLELGIRTILQIGQAVEGDFFFQVPSAPPVGN